MRNSLLKYGRLLGDLLTIMLAFGGAYLVRYDCGLLQPRPGQPPFRDYWPAICLALGVWIILDNAMPLDRVWCGPDSALGISDLALAVAILMVAVLTGSFLARVYYSRFVLAAFAILLMALLLAVRGLSHALGGWLGKYGIGVRRVVIVGQSDLADELVERTRQHPELGYKVVGFLAPMPGRGGPCAVRGEGGEGAKGTVLGRSEAAAEELARQGVQELVFALPVRRESEMLNFIAHCQRLGIAIKLVPEYYALHTTQIERASLDGIPLLKLKEASPAPIFLVVKRLFDFLLASGLLVVLSPLLLGVGAALYLITRRVLRRETRVGLDGVPFGMFRFDTTLADRLPPRDASTWKVRLGRFLSRYSLTELPQLLNVLKGEMSLVGPRPETPERVRNYSAWHQRRLRWRPGITGLAQVKGVRGFDSSDVKTKFDLEYAATFSPLLDWTLLLATLGTLIKRSKAVRVADTMPHEEPVRARAARARTWA